MTQVEEAPWLLVDRAEATGLDFRHFNGMSGEYYFAEPLGSGAALFDYDGDGDLDAYLVQGAMLGDRASSEATFPPEEPTPRDRLFRNELVESGALRFSDVTAEAGIDSTGYGMGVIAGDYDGDGDVDLYVTNYGPNLLLRNEGDGTFTDQTRASGAVDDRWNASAAFADSDGDGDLDLFLTAYVDFSLSNPGLCRAESTARDYCGPKSYRALPDRFFRNLGNGRFEDVTAESGIASVYGAGLGVIASDLDGDGRVDFYVANDDDPNQLWLNRGDGRFEETALLAGCALDAAGETEAGMGVDAGDFDGDGDDDLFMTHLTGETNTLYVNDGSGVFEDRTRKAKLNVASRAFTGFGTAWVDLDGDGRLDLFVANGAVKVLAELARRGDPYPLHQVNQLFLNLGDGTFRDGSDRIEPLSEVSRGAAFGDVDNDGDTDVLVTNNSGPARLLVNGAGNLNPWLGLRVALGARVEVALEDGRVLARQAQSAGSYASSNDPRVLVGLGRSGAVRRVRVLWPDGAREEWTGLESGRYHDLIRGEGAAIDG